MPDPARRYVLPFDDIGLGDVAAVGGKTASLGELRRLLHDRAVTSPDGFAVTAAAYRDALEIAAALVTMGIDSISVNPASFPRAVEVVAAAEAAMTLAAGGVRAPTVKPRPRHRADGTPCFCEIHRDPPQELSA